MESNYVFEIHFDGNEIISEISATDIIEAILKIITQYKEAFGITLTSNDFYLIEG